MRRLDLIVFAFCLCSFLAGCGQKGPLKLPPDAGPPATKMAESGAKK
ncbi:MAG: lipoprotein [Betaproteobacteria bacterium]